MLCIIDIVLSTLQLRAWDIIQDIEVYCLHFEGRKVFSKVICSYSTFLFEVHYGTECVSSDFLTESIHRKLMCRIPYRFGKRFRQ